MDNSIIFITKSLHHYATAKEALLEEKADIPLFFDSDPDVCNEIAQSQIAQGTRVIISTDYLCDMFMQNFDIPVIPVKRNSYSFTLRILSAFKNFDKVAIICREGSATFSLAAGEAQALFPDRAKIYRVNRVENTAEVTEKIYSDGYRAVLGPYWTRQDVTASGMTFFDIPLPKRDFIDALHQAQYNLKVYMHQLQSQELIHILLNIAQEGIVAIDASGHVLHINQTAANIFNSGKTGLIGQNYMQTPLSKLEITSIIQDGHTVNGQIAELSTGMIIYNAAPVWVDDKLDMIVITCNPIEQVQEAERKIRKRLLPTGNSAYKTFKSIVGSSAKLAETIETSRQYAGVDSTVLISAPSGSGKEVFAQSIHNASRRSSKPFMVINCAALPENILESILFGYEPGTFTGAKTNGKAGLFELAHGGTVFLDEVSEIPLSMQARFLRVLQEREVMRIGSDRSIPIDIRIIAATNRDMLKMVADGTFREDLYYRLSVLLLEIPPLSQRLEDIVSLSKYFLAYRSAEMGLPAPYIDDSAFGVLQSIDYPGNVRQLNNILERAMVLSPDGRIDAALIRRCTGVKASAAPLVISQGAETLKDRSALSERDAIIAALARNGQSRKATAAELGISTSTLWRKCKALGVQ